MIEHFITDYQRNACFTAFPSLGIEWQKLENPSMRRSLGMQARPRGPARPARLHRQQGAALAAAQQAGRPAPGGSC